jgi:hypothetical protein
MPPHLHPPPPRGEGKEELSANLFILADRKCEQSLDLLLLMDKTGTLFNYPPPLEGGGEEEGVKWLAFGQQGYEKIEVYGWLKGHEESMNVRQRFFRRIGP